MEFLQKIGIAKDQTKIFLSSIAAVCGFGLISYASLPIMIGATMGNLGLSEAEVGQIYSLEFLAAALSSIIIAPLIGSINRRKIALCGALLAIGGNLASAQWCTHEMLLIIRSITGLGAGLVLACGNATISNARNPERIAGLLNVFFAALLIVLMMTLPKLEVIWHLEGIFIGLAAIMVILLHFVLLMPPKAAENYNSTLQVAQNSDHSSVPAVNVGVMSSVGIAIFIVFFLFTFRDNMAWSFAERIGVEAGFTTSEVGGLLSLQGLLGLVGPVIATIVGFRMGVKFPVLFGIIFAGLITFVVFLSVSNQFLYVTALMCWTASYFYAITYLTAYAATLDLNGRIVAASGSAMVLGVAAGPAVSGYIISNGGYDMNAWLTLILVAIMLIAILFTFRKTRKSYTYRTNR